jgi:hypothetical protein
MPDPKEQPEEQDATVTAEDPETGEREKVEENTEPQSNDADVEPKDA